MRNKIEDRDGLVIGKAKRGVHYVLAPDGEFHGVPKSIEASELFDDQESFDQSLHDLAAACVKVSDIAVIGRNKDGEIIGSVFLKGKIITAATMRRAARASVKAGYREAVVVVKEDLDERCREAAMVMFDMCLVKLQLLVV